MTAVRIPPVLRPQTGGEQEVEVEGETVREVLDDLVERFPELADRLFSDGTLARFVNVYVDSEDVRTLQGMETPVADDSTVILLPAVAGGSSVEDFATESGAVPAGAVPKVMRSG